MVMLDLQRHILCRLQLHGVAQTGVALWTCGGNAPRLVVQQCDTAGAQCTLARQGAEQGSTSTGADRCRASGPLDVAMCSAAVWAAASLASAAPAASCKLGRKHVCRRCLCKASGARSARGNGQ